MKKDKEVIYNFIRVKRASTGTYLTLELGVLQTWKGAKSLAQKLFPGWELLCAATDLEGIQNYRLDNEIMELDD